MQVLCKTFFILNFKVGDKRYLQTVAVSRLGTHYNFGQIIPRWPDKYDIPPTRSAGKSA